jgi:NADH dehydrogenase
MKTVVVVGAGFAGVNAVRTLARQRDIRIILIDKKNYHLFQPLLYQVATGGLDPSDIAPPIRSIFNNRPNVTVLKEEVQSIDFNQKAVTTDYGTVPYDYLALCCGCRYIYFGHDEWEKFAPSLKSVEQAMEIRNRILEVFEEAERETDKERQKKLLNFVVIGGGPTGVELSGAIAEMCRFTLARDFRNISPQHTQIHLVEAGGRILSMFNEKLSRRAQRDLEKMGVKVLTGTRVTDIREGEVRLGDEAIPTQTVIWAAGVSGLALNATLGVALDKRGGIVVQPDLSIQSHPEVFVAGDQASTPGPGGRPLPQLASVALQQGTFVGKTIKRELAGKPRGAFSYFNKGSLATIGRSKAVLEKGMVHLGGIIAWLVWAVVHLWYLTGFRNRFFVFFQWAVSYLHYQRGSRIILDHRWRCYPDILHHPRVQGEHYPDGPPNKDEQQ